MQQEAPDQGGEDGSEINGVFHWEPRKRWVAGVRSSGREAEILTRSQLNLVNIRSATPATFKIRQMVVETKGRGARWRLPSSSACTYARPGIVDHRPR